MAKKPSVNKAVTPGENKMVRVRVLPLRGIGGIGGPGAEGFLPEDQAMLYVADGYAELVKDEPSTIEPSPLP